MIAENRCRRHRRRHRYRIIFDVCVWQKHEPVFAEMPNRQGFILSKPNDIFFGFPPSSHVASVDANSWHFTDAYVKTPELYILWNVNMYLPTLFQCTVGRRTERCRLAMTVAEPYKNGCEPSAFLFLFAPSTNCTRFLRHKKKCAALNIVRATQQPLVPSHATQTIQVLILALCTHRAHDIPQSYTRHEPNCSWERYTKETCAVFHMSNLSRKCRWLQSTYTSFGGGRSRARARIFRKRHHMAPNANRHDNSPHCLRSHFLFRRLSLTFVGHLAHCNNSFGNGR